MSSRNYSCHMDINQDRRKIVEQHKYLNTGKDRIPRRRGNKSSSSKYSQRVKVKEVVDLPHRSQKHEFRIGANDKVSAQLNSSTYQQHQCVEGNAAKDDELVKYMSSLPGYLRLDKNENFQEKALNVGVLDWARLEKWKHKQRHIPAKVGNTSFSGRMPTVNTTTMASFSGVHYSENYAHQSQLHRPPSSIDKSYYRDYPSQSGKIPSWKIVPSQEPEIAQEVTLGELLKMEDEDNDQEISSEMEIPLSSLRDRIDSRASKKHVRVQSIEAMESLKELQGLKVTKGDKNLAPPTKDPLSVFINRDPSSSFTQKASTKSHETKRRTRNLRDSDIRLGDQLCIGEQKDIVLLFPRNYQHSHFSKVNMHPEPGMSSNKNLTGECQNLKKQKKQVLHSHSRKFKSIQVHSEIPHSCPLPSGVEHKTKVNVMPCSRNTQENEFSSVSCELLHRGEVPHMLSDDRLTMKPTIPKSLEEELEDKRRSSVKPAISSSSQNLNVLHQETADTEANRDRNPSPNQRLSFNLPRLSRSFSLKEGPTIPRLNSTYVSVKSGPVRSEMPAQVGSASGDRANDNNRSKISPLRRLLDPLWKSKKADSFESARNVQPLKKSLDLDCKQLSSAGPHTDKRDEKTMIQASLQLTVKNELPLYNFVVDNGSSILAASTRYFNLPGKDDSGHNYLFYSVDEIKEKSGSWLSQGSKDSRHGFAYNVVGQMEVTSYNTINLAGDGTDEQHSIKEAVMYGVELRQADKELPKLVTKSELAAVVIKNPIKGIRHGEQQGNEDKDYLKKSCTQCFSADRFLRSEAHKSTAIILPGGSHGMPHDGKPASLISRWKFGGSCDCGGWDIGCKLRVLSIKNCSKIHGTSKACWLSDCFALYDQGEVQQKSPVLSLTPSERGMYTVKFEASISSLQAIFISVALLSNQNQSNVSGVSDLAEGKAVPEPSLGENDKMACPAIVSVQGSYVPNPPNSPVSRA